MRVNKLKSALIGTAAGGTMMLGLASGPAHAAVVLGINLPSGATLSAEVIDETSISGVGQPLSGLGVVTAITGPSLIPTYTYGQNGDFLTFTFTGFVSSFVLVPTVSSTGAIEFIGGSVNAYVEKSAPNLATGSQATDLANASSGSLFLNATPQLFPTNPTVQSAGGPPVTTLEAILPNNSTLDNFSNAFGSAFFDATGGAAQAVFHTCSFTGDAIAGLPCPPGLVDMTFTENLSSKASGDFPVSGTGTLKADLIPEPLSLSFLGAGLIAIGGMSWRLRRKT